LIEPSHKLFGVLQHFLMEKSLVKRDNWRWTKDKGHVLYFGVWAFEATKDKIIEKVTSYELGIYMVLLLHT
jgi:hypothetical protein